MTKIRLSYSLIKLFEQNRIDDLINYYFKTGETLKTRQMEEGIVWDKLAMESITSKKCLPNEFNGIELKDPKPQHKLVVPWGDDYELVCKLDVFDVNTVYELKTGESMDSADYCNEKQIGVYMLACEMSNTPVDKGIIIHFNQTKPLGALNPDMSLVWKTDELLEQTTKWLDENAIKIRELFESKGLI